MKCPQPPDTFQRTRMSPTWEELDWIYEWVREIQPERILEFGVGASTWAIYQAAKGNGLYYAAFEDYQPIVDVVAQHLPVKIYEQYYFGWRPFDFVFVDSSVGCGHEGMHREKSIIAAEPHMAPGCYVMLHDWRRKGRGYRKARNHLEQCGLYEFVDSIHGRTGAGLYKRV